MNIIDLLNGKEEILNQLGENSVINIYVGHVFITVDEAPLYYESVKTPAFVLMTDFFKGSGPEEENNNLELEKITAELLIEKIKNMNVPINNSIELNILIKHNEFYLLDVASERNTNADIVNPIFTYNIINEPYDKNLILYEEGLYYYDKLLGVEGKSQGLVKEFTSKMLDFEPNGNIDLEFNALFEVIDLLIKKGIIINEKEKELMVSSTGIRSRLELYKKLLYGGSVISGRVQHCKNAIEYVLQAFVNQWIKRNLFRRVSDKDDNIPNITYFNKILEGAGFNMWNYMFGGSKKTHKYRSEQMRKTKRQSNV
jgi:hypothetical protein